jgi:(1->4)-alpha-D-glucan 1-alpha-D-glucosylmutase
VASTERIATYRLQLTPSFGFVDTIRLLDHLVALGVSHLYLSPVAEAVPGSLHGYDVVDHTAVRTDFGGEAALWSLLDAAAELGLGVIIDHVPNHMSAAEAHLNAWWWSMLRDGPRSPAADWFDVDWQGDGRVIVPKLGEPLDDVLARGGLERGDGDLGPELRYGTLRFPLAPGTEHLAVGEAVHQQHYRLQWWRAPERNVRRFFTIDDLVAVRVERPAVAAVVDTIPTRLASHPAFAGVRVDHVDGLANPEGYLRGLRSRIGDDRWLLVEKILAVGETLVPSWPVDGTTGYEHIRVVEHASISPAAERPLTLLWNDLTHSNDSFEQVEDRARREVLAADLRPDLDRLVRAVRAELPDRDPDRLRDAVVEMTIGMQRYRTYLVDDATSTVELGRAHERARLRRPDLASELGSLAVLFQQRPAIATRWEQLCSPVMAKGAEDRAFYRYLRLASWCEVGGAPDQWAISIEEFHRQQSAVQELAPATLLAGTTHDTKRSEGVRSRSLALAEIADDWATVVREWFGDHGTRIEESGLDAASALLALQTVVTAWPIDADRLTEYLVKSAREAELYTSWIDPHEEYESALGRLADDLVGALADPAHDDGAGHALADVVERIAPAGQRISLGSLAIRLTAPGVPDLYQGTAAFTYTLVDPDNRTEPDWEERRSLVARANRIDGPTSLASGDVEAAKAVVITRVLATRRRHLAAFGAGAGYRPLVARGRHADRVLAFARHVGDVAHTVTAVVTRPSDEVGWAETEIELPDGSWRNVLADDAEVVHGGTWLPTTWFDHFPVAVFERVDD